MGIVKFGDVVERINIKVDQSNPQLNYMEHGRRIIIPIKYYVGGEHIEGSEFMVHKKALIQGSTIGYQFQFGFRKGDILFMTKNPHLRKASMVDFDGLCSIATFVIASKSNNLLQNYLLLEMQSDRFWQYCEDNKSGGVNYFINWGTLSNYEFDLPPIEKQKELADKLWAAYRLKEGYKRLLAAIDEMVKSQFIEMFGDAEKKPFVDVCINKGEYGSNSPADDYDGNIRYVRITDITEEGNLNSLVVSPRKVEEKYMLLRDDLLFARTGNTVGKTYLHRSGRMIFAGYLIRYRLNNKLMLPQFAFAYTHTNQYYDWVEKIKKVGAQPNISAAQYDSMPIPVPSMAKQIEFVSIAKQADKSKFGDFKSQFIEMFGNPVNNSKSWPTKAIMEVAPEQPSKKQMPGKVWLLNLDMIESNTGKVIEKVYEISDNTLSVQPFDEDNVLFSKLRPYLNKVVVPDEYGLATTELVPLRPNQEVLNKVFLSYLLRSQQFVTFANKISGGTKMPRMPLAELRNFKCILPPMSEQLKFVSIAKQADKSKSYVRIAFKNLESMLGYCIRQIS